MSVTLLWTAAATIGMIASLYGIAEAIADLAALGGIGNGRRMVARQRLYAQSARFVAFACYVILAAMTLAAGLEPRINAATVLLILPNLLQTSIVLTDVYTGRRLRAEYRDQRLIDALAEQLTRLEQHDNGKPEEQQA